VIPSSETEARSRGRLALDRDRTSLEGGPSPARCGNSAVGGDQPSSEAEPLPRGDRPLREVEPHLRGRPALERGEVVLVRRRTPRAERSSARGWLGRSSGGPWVCGFVLRVFYTNVSGFSLVI
jgi:hypothetical protein